jgi:putative tryptophan/tyrosine transport system substrate-binding protein
LLDLRRRAFLSLIGGAASWPLAARAQQPAPVIGFLGPATSAAFVSFLRGFRRGLAEAGFVEGRNVAIEYRWADNQTDRLPSLAADLVSRPVAVLVAGSATAAALAAKGATESIPIVFTVGADPVKFGLVASMNRPGGNVTGVSFLANALVAKHLELLQDLALKDLAPKDLAPAATVIGVLANPNNPNAAFDIKDVQTAAAALGRQVHVAYATGERELDAAVSGITGAGAAALLVAPDALFITARARLAALAVQHHLPTIVSNRLYVEDGGLLSYGASIEDAYRQAGVYCGRILKGEKPADLPVMQPTKFELVINLKTAKALGLEVPPTLLARADEVIE